MADGEKVTVTYQQGTDVLRATVDHALLIVPAEGERGYMVRTSATKAEAVTMGIVLLDMLEHQGILDHVFMAWAQGIAEGGPKIRVL